MKQNTIIMIKQLKLTTMNKILNIYNKKLNKSDRK